jgi:hypothetical protein
LQEIVPYEFLSSMLQPYREILFQNKFSVPLSLLYENCKRPCRLCNIFISLQFLYQFAILTFWCMVPTWMFAISIWVCNFQMSLQFSYQFAILTSQLQTSYVHGFIWITMLLFAGSRKVLPPQWMIGQENLIALALSSSLRPRTIMRGSQRAAPMN